jgi:hypothetical protein
MVEEIISYQGVPHVALILLLELDKRRMQLMLAEPMDSYMNTTVILINTFNTT